MKGLEFLSKSLARTVYFVGKLREITKNNICYCLLPFLTKSHQKNFICYGLRDVVVQLVHYSV